MQFVLRSSSLRRSIEVLEQRIAPAALVALDNNNHLLSFDSSSTGTITTIAVTGLAAGETLIGIDVRPATGGLYGIAADDAGVGHIYLINPSTGTATLSSTLVADPADNTSPFTSLSGTNFGVDFNPVPDRLRVVSDTNQNLRINVDNGFVTTDLEINPNGSTIAGAAYASSFAGADSTVLYDLEVASDQIYLQTPPNDGTLTDPRPLGVDASGVGGFDIVSTRDASGAVTDTGFAALTVGGVTGLYQINLNTGAATGGSTIASGSTPLRGLAALTGAPAARAFTIEQVGNHLLSFNTATPNDLMDLGAITGIPAGVEPIIGFDFRPSDGQLYVVTKDANNSSGKIYTVNTGTAAATFIGTLAADPNDASSPYVQLNGINFGVDFNPAADRLRIVSDTGENYRVRIDPNAGVVASVITDTDLNGVGGISVTAAAYTSNFAGTFSTRLYDIDVQGDRLLQQVNPNGGTVAVMGTGLGVDVGTVNGFDIGTNGEAFATFTVGGVASLYRIDLNAGTATAVGTVGSGGSTLVTTAGLALAPRGSFQFSSTTVTIPEAGGEAVLTIDRVGGADGMSTVLVNTTSGTAGSSDYTTFSRTVTFGPGVTSQNISIPITSDLLIEGDETFTVTLSEPTGGAQLNTIQTTAVTITDDEPTGFAATSLIGLDSGNNLISFSSSAPGTVTGTTPVTGLGAGEALVAIDFRPATGGLYGITIDSANAGRIYLINPSTGAAAFSASLTADPADGSAPYTGLSGTNFGADFNPVPDRLRVVSDTNQNLRINVDNGFVTTDLEINPAGSALAGAAYLNSFAGATGTTLFDIDVAGDRLVTQSLPNDGTLTNSQPLGIDATGVGGFDIVSTRDAAGIVTNTSFAALTVNGLTSLYTIDLATGRASSFGTVDDGSVQLRGLTSAASLSAGGAAAATAFTIDASNTLLRFDVATPNNTVPVGIVSGIGGGETIVGFDFRPANGLLYAVTKDASNAGHLYTVDPASAAATLLFTLAADGADTTDGNPAYTSLAGTDFGVDFNPTADRLRIVSNTNQSLRVNVATGLVFTDGGLSGTGSGVAGAAYTNSFAGAPGTVLYDLHAANDALYIQSPPNNGTLTLVGSGLGVGDVTAVGGFDIRANGEAFATMTVGGVESLYRIDLTAGTAALVGAVGAGVASTLGLALAPSGTFQFDTTSFTASEAGGFATITINRVGGAFGPASVQVDFTDGSARGASDFTPTSRVVTFAADELSRSIQIPLTQDTLVEGTESFYATLSNPTGGASINRAHTAIVSIADDDANLYAIDHANHLLTFSNHAPGTVAATTTVTGLGAGETLVGIDFRPATGLLYGMTIGAGAAGRIYVIDPATGAATFGALLKADPADTTSTYTHLNGSNFGFDFNPVADRLRVVSNLNQNLRIDVDTGLVTTDLPITPASTVAASAYTNAFNPTSSAVGTALYAIDTFTDQLVLQNPPNDGAVTQVGPLNVDASGVAGFDIISARSPDGTITNLGYAALTVGGSTGLFTIDLTTGAASLVGALGDGTNLINGLTAAVAAPAAKAFTVGSGNTLLSFNTATPGVTTNVGTISGITAGETVIGFDFRPADGLLYVLTQDFFSDGRLYTVDPVTAVATALGKLGFDPADSSIPFIALTGTKFDVDFNPQADRLRIVSDSGQNLRVNVDTRLVTTDDALNGPATGASGAAYLNNVAGAIATTLFEIDAATNTLYSLANPNNGTLTPVGAGLGVDPTAVSGFDIRSNGEAFANLTVNGLASLYRIDLQTGAATLVGAIGTGTATTGFALAPSGTIQFSSPTFSFSEGAGHASLTLERIGGSEGTVTVFVNTVDGTAGSADYNGAQQVITFGPGVTTQTVLIPITNDTLFEPSETFTAGLSGPVGGAGVNHSANSTTVTILNDDLVSLTGKVATYRDVDGDLVTVRITAGTLSAASFTFAPAGTLGGLQLQKLDLSSSVFLNSNVTFTAKRTAAGGDGFVNVGYIDAHGNTLGAVSVNGDLGQIDANAAKALGVLSLGKLGLATQGAGGSLQSTFVANLPILIVRTDLVDATITAQNFTAVTVFGNVIGGPGDHSGSIEAAGRIGSLVIAGTLRGGADAESGSIIAKTTGALRIREIDGGRIFIAGNPVGPTATAANVRSALALGSLTVLGSVQNANILVGFDRNGAPVNADVTTGAISVSQNWVASNLSAGVRAGSEGFHGSDTGSVIPNGGAVISRIASITVKGQVYGTIANTSDRFGFVAEQIGAFTVGTTRLPLSSLATAPKDRVSIGFTADVLVREY